MRVVNEQNSVLTKFILHAYGSWTSPTYTEGLRKRMYMTLYVSKLSSINYMETQVELQHHTDIESRQRLRVGPQTLPLTEGPKREMVAKVLEEFEG